MMPGLDHTGSSIITALVTSDPKKAETEATFKYEEFPQALASGSFDAIYVATPNWRHDEFVVQRGSGQLHPIDHVRSLLLAHAIMVLGHPVDLRRCDIKFAIRPPRHGVRPLQAIVLNDNAFAPFEDAVRFWGRAKI